VNDPLQKRGPGRQLPAGETLRHHELEKGAQQDRPEDGGAEKTPDERAGGQITAADAGSGQQEARPDGREGEDFFAGRLRQLTLDARMSRVSDLQAGTHLDVL